MLSSTSLNMIFKEICAVCKLICKVCFAINQEMTRVAFETKANNLTCFKNI